MLIHILNKEIIMLKLIKSAFLNTLIVFLAEFVALILLATLVYVNKLSPKGFRKYEPFYLSGISEQFSPTVIELC